MNAVKKPYANRHLILADTHIYQNTQPFFTAPPIFKNPSDDPFPNNRSGLIRLEKDTLDIDFSAENIQFET